MCSSDLTWVDYTKDVANGIIGWIRENQDTITQGYEFIRSIVNNRSLPEVTPTATEVPLPDIN